MTRPHGQDKARARANRSIVNQILMEHWDPIGLGEDCPADEYIGYANRVYVMMMHEEASVADVTDFLHGIATDYIGLPRTPRRFSADAARLIFSHKADFMAGDE